MPAVTMPRLSDSMEEGTIVRWLRAHGDQISAGDELVEIETDKATMAYEAESDGVLTITEQEGATVRVGATIAHIGDDGTPEASNGSVAGAPASAPAATIATAASPGAAGPLTDSPAAASQRAAAAADGARIKASPVARRLAHALGVAIETLTGSGPAGRIVKRDVEAAANAAPAAPAGSTAAVKGESEFRTLVGVQATIARRMAEAKSTMPEFALTTEVDMEAAVALRAQFAALGDEQRPPSLGDFVIRACALALRAHPQANASYRDGGVERYSRVNVGVAVASPEALFVPTVFDADRKSLGEIAADVRALAGRGRDGALTPPEMGGATFTVSNLGMYGVTHFTAVLNPPQAAILAVGAVEQRVVPVDGVAAVRHRMTMTLTCDHRVLYGADAAEFLATIRTNLEQPMRLVL